MRALTLLGTLLAIATGAADARAETFEQAAAGAKAVRVDDLVWAVAAPCTGGDDTQNRQCRILRDQRAKQVAGATLLVEADADALTVGAWDKARKSVPLRLTACIRCKGIEISGRTYVVQGGSTATAPTLFDNTRRFADEAAATAWIKSVQTVRVELLIKGDKHPWQASGADGLGFDVIGYRVTTPCDGSIVLASPAAAAVPADKTACKAP